MLGKTRTYGGVLNSKDPNVAGGGSEYKQATIKCTMGIARIRPMIITEEASPKIGKPKIIETDPCIQAVRFFGTSLDSCFTPLGYIKMPTNCRNSVMGIVKGTLLTYA